MVYDIKNSILYNPPHPPCTIIKVALYPLLSQPTVLKPINLYTLRFCVFSNYDFTYSTIIILYHSGTEKIIVIINTFDYASGIHI